MRPLATYKKILAAKGLRFCLHEAYKKMQRFHFVREDELLELHYEYRAYDHLKKYVRVLRASGERYDWLPAFATNPYPDRIWVAWLQGEEQAPALVRKCIASIRRHAAGREVVVITENNLPQYVSFPDFILKKRAKGSITNTHFSDLLRIALLAQYGGVWIDATVYLTAPLPRYILDAPLFCYKNPCHVGKLKASSWFIAAAPNQEILVLTLRLLTCYWKKRNYLYHYYLFHLFFSIAIDSSDRLARQWKEVPCFNNVNPHTLLRELTGPYDAGRWEQIKAISPVHKLTYKIKQEDAERPGTYLQMILDGCL